MLSLACHTVTTKVVPSVQDLPDSNISPDDRPINKNVALVLIILLGFQFHLSL